MKELTELLRILKDQNHVLWLEGGRNEHRKQITRHLPSKFQTNKPLCTYNRGVFACGSWTFPLITLPQFGLGYIILGVIITETYFMIFTILCSLDKSGGVDTGKVPPHDIPLPLPKHHNMRAYGECTYISLALDVGEKQALCTICFTPGASVL